MLRKLSALLAVMIVAIGVSAQDDACSIFGVSSFGDGGHELALYTPESDSYEKIASVADEYARAVYTTNLSSEHVRAATVQSEDVRGTTLNFYTLLAGGIMREEQVNVGELLPRVNGWSSNGRYLALGARESSLGIALLYVYDTETGVMSPTFGAVQEDYGVSWAPGQDALAYVLLDGIYASAPDGLAYWSQGGLANVASLRWMSGTALAVTRCDDICTTAFPAVFSGDERTVEFGAYMPEAYIAWRDSYIVTRVEDGAIGVWNEANGFRLYTGRRTVTSRPTLTSDGRHISVRIEGNDGQASVLVGDLIDSKLWYTLPLSDTADFSDEQFGAWNVREQKFLYTDNGTAYVYDAMANETIATIEGVTQAQWVCPSRG